LYVGRGTKNSPKELRVMKFYRGSWNWTDSLELNLKDDTRFGKWSVGRVYRAGLLKTVASEFTKNNLHVVSVQEVRPEKDGNEPADDYVFFCGNGATNHHLATDIFVHKGIVSAVKGVEFVSHRMPYILQTDR
jgi:hypothetical protein